VGQQLVVFTKQLTVGHSVSLTLQELFTAFDAYVTVRRLIIQNVVTVCNILAKKSAIVKGIAACILQYGNIILISIFTFLFDYFKFLFI
jgi:hypothetical protein